MVALNPGTALHIYSPRFCSHCSENLKHETNLSLLNDQYRRHGRLERFHERSGRRSLHDRKRPGPDSIINLLGADRLYRLDHFIAAPQMRSEEHTSELQSIMIITYAVF